MNGSCGMESAGSAVPTGTGDSLNSVYYKLASTTYSPFLSCSESGRFSALMDFLQEAPLCRQYATQENQLLYNFASLFTGVGEYFCKCSDCDFRAM